MSLVLGFIASFEKNAPSIQWNRVYRVQGLGVI